MPLRIFDRAIDWRMNQVRVLGIVASSRASIAGIATVKDCFWPILLKKSEFLTGRSRGWPSLHNLFTTLSGFSVLRWSLQLGQWVDLRFFADFGRTYPVVGGP